MVTAVYSFADFSGLRSYEHETFSSYARDESHSRKEGGKLYFYTELHENQPGAYAAEYASVLNTFASRLAEQQNYEGALRISMEACRIMLPLYLALLTAIAPTTLLF
jgi:hypothetical protein